MHFCLITPLQWLPQMIQVVESEGPGEPVWHMVLAQYLSVDSYLQAYTQLKLAGHKLILDSGVYEGAAVSLRRLLECVQLLKPDVVILPDVPANTEETLMLSEQFLSTLQTAKLEVQTMAVLHTHCNSLQRAKRAYKETVQLCTNYIGLSRLTLKYGPLTGDNRRVHFIQRLQESGDWESRVKHHALGMIAGSSAELWALNRLGVFSCDSSAPIWRGAHGKRLDHVWVDKPFSPFATSMHSSNLNIATDNLKEVLSACRST